MDAERACSSLYVALVCNIELVCEALSRNGQSDVCLTLGVTSCLCCVAALPLQNLDLSPFAKAPMSKYPDFLTPNGTPTKGSKGQKSRARREPSGVFSLFQAPQIQQFKEAFQLIDHDKDGWVNESDLKEIFTSLGRALTRFGVDLTF